jgi:outer membrane protein assembly factor BamB
VAKLILQIQLTMTFLPFVSRLLTATGALLAGWITGGGSPKGQWPQIWGGTSGVSSAPAIFNPSIKWTFDTYAPDPDFHQKVNGMTCIGLDGTIYYLANSTFAFHRNGSLIWTLPIDGEMCAISNDGKAVYVVPRFDTTLYSIDANTGSVATLWSRDGIQDDDYFHSRGYMFKSNVVQVTPQDDIFACFNWWGQCHIFNSVGDLKFSNSSMFQLRAFSGPWGSMLTFARDGNIFYSSRPLPHSRQHHPDEITYWNSHQFTYWYNSNYEMIQGTPFHAFTTPVESGDLLYVASGPEYEMMYLGESHMLSLVKYPNSSSPNGFAYRVCASTVYHCPALKIRFEDYRDYYTRISTGVGLVATPGYRKFAVLPLPRERSAFFCGQKFGPDGGEPTWIARNCSFASTAAVLAGEGSVIYTTCRGDDLTALSATDGSVLWTVPMNPTVLYIAVAGDGTIYVTDGLGLHSIGPSGEMGSPESIRRAIGQTAATNALSQTVHKDAKFAIRAIRSVLGSFPDRDHALRAGDLGPSLLEAGFVEASFYVRREAGDVVIWGATADHPHGHIQIYFEGRWYSDYAQDRFIPWRRRHGSRATYYRYRGKVA